MHYSLESLRGSLHDIYDNGVGRGLMLSLPVWHDSFSIVPGSTLYVYGPPHTGKTQMIFDLIIDVCMKYNLNALITSPEEGEPHEVYKTLIEMVAQKDYVDTFHNQMTLEERLVAETWVNDHFTVVDIEDANGETYTLEGWYDNIERVERETGKTFHITVIDPFDEIKIDWAAKRTDLVLQDKLIYVRKHAKAFNKYHIIGVHVRDQKKISQKINGVMQHYYPPPDPQDLAHGQEWFRRGMAMIGLWRPPTFLDDLDTLKPYDPNSTVVSFGKQKPKKVKKQGSNTRRIHLHWCAKRHRYYQDVGGVRMYPPRLNETIDYDKIIREQKIKAREQNEYFPPPSPYYF